MREGGRTVDDSMEDYELCGACANDAKTIMSVPKVKKGPEGRRLTVLPAGI